MSTQHKTNDRLLSFFSQVRSRTSILPGFLLAGALATASARTATASEALACVQQPVNREQRRAAAKLSRRKR